jgi:curved DNA-binding protein CbpA
MAAAGGGDPDPYAVLNVARTATAGEIRAAYLALVARYHPDRHQGNPLEELAAARMTEINRAYAVLSDPARRAAADAAPSSTARPDRPGAAATTGAAADRLVGKRLVKLAAALMALPLVVRLVPAAARALGALARLLFEAASTIRGPRLAAAAALAALTVILVAARRRRRQR